VVGQTIVAVGKTQVGEESSVEVDVIGIPVLVAVMLISPALWTHRKPR